MIGVDRLLNAVRRLARRPWHTVVVVAVFAVGSGASLTIFRLVDAVLLRPLPYANADRLVRVMSHLPIVPMSEMPFSDVGYRSLERRSHSFSGVAGFRVTGVNMTIGERSERVLSARVTGNFFDVLGVRPALGGGFAGGEESAKMPTRLILSDAFWRKSFAADPRVLGRTVRVDGAPATIVGVANASLTFPVTDVGYWTLMDLDPVGTQPFQLGIDAVARLRDDATIESATVDATTVLRQFAHENPGPHSTADADVSGFHSIVRPIRDEMVGGVRPTVLLLMIAACFVLGLTCVNVATLELVRSSGRRAELAIRVALGASRINLIGGSIAEAVLQAGAGVAIGFGLSAGVISLFRGVMPDAIGAATTQPGIGMIAAVVLAVVICAGASAAFPFVAAMDGDVQSALRDRTAGSARATRVRRILIVAQLGFACMLVEGAALMTATVQRSQSVALGFRPSGLTVVQMSLPPETYPSADQVTTAFRDATERMRAIPGVADVGLASTLPLDAEQTGTLLGVEGRAFRADGSDPNVDFRIVSPGYFRAMGLRVMAGRAFSDGDAYLDGTPVLISETLAKLLWPDGTSPIGQRVRTGAYAPWMPIVGVISDAKNRSLTQPSHPELYLPFGAPRSPMRLPRDMAFVIRASGPSSVIAAAAQRVARDINPDLPVYGARSFADVIARSQVRELTTARAMAVFAVVALLLAIAGSYAVLMFSVVERRRELAVRRAIGATASRVMALIGREMGQLLALGAVFGLTAIVLLSRVLSRFLFGVSVADLGVAVTTLLILALAGVCATLVPAYRAGASDPMLTLRE